MSNQTTTNNIFNHKPKSNYEKNISKFLAERNASKSCLGGFDARHTGNHRNRSRCPLCSECHWTGGFCIGSGTSHRSQCKGRRPSGKQHVFDGPFTQFGKTDNWGTITNNEPNPYQSIHWEMGKDNEWIGYTYGKDYGTMTFQHGDDGKAVSYDKKKVIDSNEDPKYRLELWNMYGKTAETGCAFGTAAWQDWALPTRWSSASPSTASSLFLSSDKRMKGNRPSTGDAQHNVHRPLPFSLIF